MEDKNIPDFSRQAMIGPNLYKAIMSVRKEIQTIKTDATNPMYHSKYTTIRQIMTVLDPLFEKYHLVFISRFDRYYDQWGIVSELSWVGDEIESTTVFFPADRIADAQQMGKLATYGRRYNLTSLFNLCFEDDEDDDDGNSLVPTPVKKTPKVAPSPIDL